MLSGSTRELIVSELLESDFIYFEQGATIESLDGAVFVQMGGLEQIAAACVAQRIDPSAISGNLEQWLFTIEDRFRKSGSALSRLYLQSEFKELEVVLKSMGYEVRTEVGLIGACEEIHYLTPLSLRPVKTEDDWQQKISLHHDCQLGPDGYGTEAEKWVEMERKKYEQGTLQSYLIEADGQVCGSIGTMEFPHLLRLKNLVIHPLHRQKGFASQAVHLCRDIGREKGKLGIGCFAIAGGIGEKVYTRCGMREMTKQVEWSKKIN